MARCITYFTMLVELLIIKNVKGVGVMLSNGYSPLTEDVFYTHSIYFAKCVKVVILRKNKAYICAVTQRLILGLFVLTCLFIQKLHVSCLVSPASCAVWLGRVTTWHILLPHN